MNTIKHVRRLLCMALAATLYLSGSAQQQAQALTPQADSLAQFVRNIYTFNQLFPREQVYLHFDNTGYFMGETLWFKAYVVNPGTNHSNVLSRVLYVELLTAEGRVIQTQKLPIVNGQAHGQFSLAELLHAGFYEVRAYTALMLNWEDAPLFSRVFPVFSVPQEEGEGMYNDPKMRQIPYSERLPQVRAKQPSQKGIAMQFFPEGGNLVEGLASNIAFKATDKRGNALQVSGKVYNNKNEEIASCTTLHDGMGQFSLTPLPGETYRVEVEAEGEKLRQFDLPAALPQGYVMTVNNLRDDFLTLQLARNGQTSAEKALGLTVMCRGRLAIFRQIEWGGQDKVVLQLPKSQLLSGVNQITLFDTEGNIHAERLAFIPTVGKANISYTKGKEEYQPKEMVEMDFKLTDEGGNPLSAVFSLSVRDADTDTPINSNYSGGIMTSMLLGSEIKGYIHDIDWYFKDDDRIHRTALDLLLCTQGWRRYDWKQMTRPKEFTVRYPAEEGILIRGDLTSTFRKRKKDGVKVSIALFNAVGENRRGSCITDSLGQFAFVAEDFVGRWEMHVRTQENDKLKEMNVNLIKVNGPDPRPYDEEETELFVRNTAGETLEALPPADTLLEYDEAERRRFENLLPVVKVEAGKEWMRHSIRRWSNMIYDMDDERMRMDETGEEYLKEFYKWLEENNPYFSFNYDTIGKLEATYKGRPVRFFINRVGTGGWLVEKGAEVSIDLENLTINDVEAIAICDKPFAEMAMLSDIPVASKGDASSTMDMDMEEGSETQSTPEGNAFSKSNSVVVNVFVRKDYFRYKDKKGYRKTKIQGFSPDREFYMPDYSFTDLPDERDFRRTLYWNPYVTSNAQGEANVRFYNNLTCKRMKVSAELITGKGRIGSLNE